MKVKNATVIQNSSEHTDLSVQEVKKETVWTVRCQTRGEDVKEDGHSLTEWTPARHDLTADIHRRVSAIFRLQTEIL